MMKTMTALACAALLSLAPGLARAQTAAAQGYAAADPTYGSANSMLHQVASVALDLADLAPEGPAIYTPEGESDTVGIAATLGKAGLQSLERYDLHYQHARRIGEGTRARFVLDLPASLLHADSFTITDVLNGVQTSFPQASHTLGWATISAGVELPVTRDFQITPRVNYSNLRADAFYGRGGERLGPSVTARWRLPQVGRGDLVLGAMVGYDHSLKTLLSTQPFYESEHFWTFRGGLAYQLPLKSRMFGRQASLRASYVFTDMTGQPFMPYKKVHELALNLGIRTREAEMKTRYEQWRVGVIFTHTDNEFTSAAGYNAGTLTLGYRF